MSLLDGLLLDALLQGIVGSPVYIALRKDFKDDQNRFGAGTMDDPYDGSKTSGGYYKFDHVMRELVNPNTLVVLGPGVFPTKGYKSDGSGWSAKSGVRIVGRGWANNTTDGPTILKLEGHAGATDVVVGHGDLAADILQGFQLEDLLIDCALPNTSGRAAGAIRINGRNIRISNIRVVGFGGVDVTECDVIRVAKPTANQSDVYNCVVTDCVIESPSSYSNSVVTCLRLSMAADATYYHRGCALRNNVIDCGNANLLFRAISATGGVGTIVELNRIWRCKYGFFADNPDHITKDLVIRDNYLHDVQNGILFAITSGASTRVAKRVVVTGNFIELPTSGSPIGIKFDGASATSPRRFGQVIVRGNEVRHIDGANGTSTAIGISLDSIDAAVEDENLVDIGDPASPVLENSLRRTSIVTVKTFNNQRTSGVFLPSVELGTLRKDPDLVTDAQDWMIGI